MQDLEMYSDAGDEILEERVSDLNGYLLESFSEAKDNELQVLADLYLEWDKATLDRLADIEHKIGVHVLLMIRDRCEPTNEEIVERVNEQRD